MRTSILLFASFALTTLTGCDASIAGSGGSGGSTTAGPGAGTGNGANGPTSTAGNGAAGTTQATGNTAATGSAATGVLPPGALFFDDFEYDVARDQEGKFDPGSAFVEAGWSRGKDAVLNGPGAGGWLYTMAPDAAPPGLGSTRVLMVESKAATYAGDVGGGWRQTDFYLQYGDTAAGPLDTIPPDVWFQQWIYIVDTPQQPSLFPPTIRLGKWIYPTRNDFPSQDLEWLFNLSGVAVDSEVAFAGSSNEISIGQQSLQFQLNLTDDDHNIFTDGRPDARDTLGSSGAAPGRLDALGANQWWLLRLHVDHTVVPGVVELWARPRGGVDVKIMDTTASSAVSWTPGNTVDGHRGFRFPTTLNNWYQSPQEATTHGDFWILIDDFAIAAGEHAGGQGAADLPTYAE